MTTFSTIESVTNKATGFDVNDNGSGSVSNYERRMLKAKRRLPKLLMPIDLTMDSGDDDNAVEQLSPPPKLKRQDAFLGRTTRLPMSIIKEKKPTYRNYNEEALSAYKVWAKNVENNEITIEEAIDLADFCNLLSYQIDGVARSLDGAVYPIMVKPIFQAAKADPKPIAEVVASRNNCFIEKDNNNNWRLKKFGKEWFTANNTMSLFGCSYMVVLLFNPKSGEVLPIDIDINKHAYNQSFRKLQDYFTDLESPQSP